MSKGPKLVVMVCPECGGMWMHDLDIEDMSTLNERVLGEIAYNHGWRMSKKHDGYVCKACYKKEQGE